jgi:hypothetical protein
VYQPGDKLPEMNIAFPAAQLEGNEIKYYPSGVFKLPYPYTYDDIQKTQTADAPAFLEKLFFSEENLLKAKMKADIPKQFKNVKDKANIPSMIKQLKFRYPIQDLLKVRLATREPWLPQGVYYHFICRAYEPVPGKHGLNEKILRTRRMSVEQQYAQMGKPTPAYNEKPFVVVKRYYDSRDIEEGYDTIEEAYNAYKSTIEGIKLFDIQTLETVRTSLDSTRIFEGNRLGSFKVPFQIVILKRQAAKGGQRKTRKQKKTKRRGTLRHRKN